MDQPGEKISVEEFDEMKNRYEQSADPTATKSVVFGVERIAALIANGTQRVRIFFGRDSEQRLTVMLKAEGSNTAAPGEEEILDRGQLCPPYCADK
jgi:hypothetical protein